MTRLDAALIAATALAYTIAPALAQTAPATRTAPAPLPQSMEQGADILVQARRMPTAEAPKAATCEALAQIPRYRSVILMSGGDPARMPTIYQPTRLPRNPDYRAPPKVPVGSPLPELAKARFGVGLVNQALTGSDPSIDTSPIIDPVAGTDYFTDPATTAGTMNGVNSLQDATLLCRSIYQRGAQGGLDVNPSAVAARPNPFGSQNERQAQYMAEMVRADTTLPMAFALFDQGRYAESFGYFKKAADKLPEDFGAEEAYLFLGKLELAGFGPKKSPVDAIGWLKKAANADFNALTDTPRFDPAQPELNTATGEAAMILAAIYARGMPGVPRDMAQACKWYDRAAEVGHIAAAKTLGDIYNAGVGGLPKDTKKAAAEYKRAAEKDLPAAQVALARLLEAGADGVPRDANVAMQWYTRAATKHEQPEAMFALALAYDTGEGGVKVDPANAFALYKAAALKGVPAAKVAVGTFFQDGTVVQKDEATARQWFEAAVKDRDPDGMYNLAAMLANGAGGPRDLVRAWVLLKRAAAAGQDGAPAALTAVEARMTPADKAAAAKQLEA